MYIRYIIIIILCSCEKTENHWMACAKYNNNNKKKREMSFESCTHISNGIHGWVDHQTCRRDKQPVFRRLHWCTV